MPSLFATLRPPFILLSPAVVAVGAAIAWLEHGAIDRTALALVTLGLVFAHASVNAFNEYFDFRSGLDLVTERTPFSGGSGTLPARPDWASATLALAIACLVGAIACGLALVARSGPGLLALGAVGVFLVVSYTRLWTRHWLACLVAPGLGLGVLPIVGTHLALTGAWSVAPVAASLPVSLGLANLLLLNQFPDVEADRTVGRRPFPVVYGLPASARLFATLWVGAGLVLIAGVAARALPATALVGLIALVPAGWAARSILHRPDERAAQLRAMPFNVMASVGLPALLAIGVAIASAY